MTQAQKSGPDPNAIRRAVRRAALLTAGAGIGYGIFTIIALYLVAQDRQGLIESYETSATYTTEDLSGSTIAGLYLLPFAAILFLWFSVALRGWIRDTQTRRNALISDLQLVSGIVFTSAFLVGAAAVASSVLVAGSESGEISAATLLGLSAFGTTVMTVMGVRIAAVFVIATASLGMTTGALPRWFNLVSYGFGLILMLSPVVEDALILAFPVWVIVLSLMLLYHILNVPTDELPGFAKRYAAQDPAEESGTELGD